MTRLGNRQARWVAVALLVSVLIGASPEWGASQGHPFGSRTFVEVVRATKGTVVNISTTENARGWNLPRLRRFLGPSRRHRRRPDFFERFAPDFGSQEQPAPRHSLGSGFIVDPGGYILTNHHVIERARVIKVTLEDRSEYVARVVGTDPTADLALLKIDAGRSLPSSRLGDSDSLEVGEWVIAIGSPFGLAHTVTVGVVSGKGRVIGASPFDDFIQTDAYINVGNSGGPLLNARGEVVGINTAIVAESLGVGFAIPVNVAKATLKDLHGRDTSLRGRLGLVVGEPSPDLIRELGRAATGGALVSEIDPEGPAARAGIRKGDVIVGFNGRRLQGGRDLRNRVASLPPGSRARLRLLRKGKLILLGVRLESGRRTSPGDWARRRLGLRVRRMSATLSRRMGLDLPGGVIITHVRDGSVARAAGLREGDVILEINRKPVRGMEDYRRLLRTSVGQKSI
ncbi:MAG: trypsin-like peptidase domain-containing protein, partial [Nitrospinota bacterium]